MRVFCALLGAVALAGCEAQAQSNRVSFTGEVPQWLSESIQICSSFLTVADPWETIEGQTSENTWKRFSTQEGFTNRNGESLENGPIDIPYYRKQFGSNRVGLFPNDIELGEVKRRQCILNVSSFNTSPPPVGDDVVYIDRFDFNFEDLMYIDLIEGISGKGEVYSLCKENFCADGFRGHWSWVVNGTIIIAAAEGNDRSGDLALETHTYKLRP